MKSISFTAIQLLLLAASALAFSSLAPTNRLGASPAFIARPVGSSQPSFAAPVRTGNTQLYMSDRERKLGKKKGVQTIIREETEEEQEEDKEEMWRVLLHNDEVHTFHYVVRSLTKVVGTLDRKAAFEVCVQTHGVGKATITQTYKKQAEQFCLGLQRQGLTVSISPDKDFDGGHSGGGL